MRFAVSMPQRFADAEFDPAAFRAFLHRAEALGFDSVWTQEEVLRDVAAQLERLAAEVLPGIS